MVWCFMKVELRGMEKLSFRERQAVALKESGNSVEQIAKKLTLGAGSVTTLLHRAKSKGYEIVIVMDADEIGLLGNNLEEEVLD